MRNRQRRPWQPRLTHAQQWRGWIYFALYVFLFPWLMGWVQSNYIGEFPVAYANAVYYLLIGIGTFVVLWSFLKEDFRRLLDWLPENLFAFATGLLGAVVLGWLTDQIPLPVQNPNVYSYPQQYLLEPAATLLILVVLMPLVEEPLFRGVLFGSVGTYSKVLAYGLSILGYALYCVWQFVFAYGGADFRYLLLMVQYLPMSLALTWSYDRGGSIWTPIFLHMLLNGLQLSLSLQGW